MTGSFIKYNWPSLLWAACILIGCLLPGRDLPDLTLLDYDKALHFVIYLVLAVSTLYGWRKQNQFSFLHRRIILKLFLFTSLYGFGVEMMQETFTADRHFDLFDAAANAAGGTAGSLLGPFILHFEREVGKK